MTFVRIGFLWLGALCCATWAFGALFYDFPIFKGPVAWTFALTLIATLLLLRGTWRKLGAIFGAFLIVLTWWLTLKPSNNREWQGDVAKTAYAEINGDVVTLHNVRNFNYRSAGDYTPQWETRTVRLSRIRGMDLFINYWGSPWMAHPIVSFQFADAPPLCFSIETRRRVAQDYSAIGGLYRQFELIYIVSEERDVIAVRTNYREGEDIYLYHIDATPAQARNRFEQYLSTLNQLHDQARWYNAITANCTTAIRQQSPAGERMPWDWRILLNGKGDELMYERHTIATGGLPFAELKKRALINEAAQEAGEGSDFPVRIRAGRPGF